MENFLKTLKETVNPATPAVGVNLLRDAAAAAEAKIRVRGKRLTICQQIAYSRYYGWSTWTDAETSHCVLGAACAGLVEPPQRVLDGSVNAGVYQADQAAANPAIVPLPGPARGLFLYFFLLFLFFLIFLF